MNIENPTRTDLMHAMFDCESGKSISSYYQLSVPIRLQLLTLHLEDADFQYAMTSLSPGGVVHSQSRLSDIFDGAALHMHHHDYYEIVFVIRGELHQLIENVHHIYPAGSCCILNKNVRHTEVLDANFQAAYLAISDDFLADLVADLSANYFAVEKNRKPTTLQAFFIDSSTPADPVQKSYVDLIAKKDAAWVARHVHRLFDVMTTEMITPKIGSSHVLRECFWQLTGLLSDEENFSTTPVQIGTSAENAIFNKITHIMEETSGRATRSELVAALHYSGTYLNDITKKYTGGSIFDYGMYFCMKKASDLLLHTRLSVQDIAQELSFSNRSHFYRIFQETYHMTPAQYRKNFRAGGNIEQTLL